MLVMLAGMRWPTSASYAADDSLYGWRSEAHHRDTDQGAILAACTPRPTILTEVTSLRQRHNAPSPEGMAGTAVRASGLSVPSSPVTALLPVAGATPRGRGARS